MQIGAMRIQPIVQIPEGWQACPPVGFSRRTDGPLESRRKRSRNPDV